MLFKLSLKNIRKSISDYTIYFLTLILGVAIFYLFNSLDSQEAMLRVSESQRSIMKLMVDMISMVSVLVAVTLGFLIVYANNFLIKRRKREFGLYMMLGMGKQQISRILFLETMFIGVLSLAIGLLVGIFGSQLMSALVARLFEADMTEYKFVFSKAAAMKTCLYFGVMYVAVMLFNVFTISKYKLIDLLTAVKKNEKVRMKNPVLCVLIFIVAVAVLSRAYYIVTGGVEEMENINALGKPVAMGVVSTFLIFWSLSGFALQLVQANKKIYLRGTNLFVLRQLHNKINTMVVSMTVICLLLFMTISVLSSGLALNNVLTSNLNEMTPVDINLMKDANLPDNGDYTKEVIEDSRLPVSETLKNNGLDMDVLKDVIEVELYATNDLTMGDSLGDTFEDVKRQFPMLAYDKAEPIMHLSDYNRVAELYGQPKYELKEDEYIILCDYENMKNLRDFALRSNTTIILGGRKYHSRYTECQTGFVSMSNSHTNPGIFLVPDSCGLTEDMKEAHFLIANYNADTEEGKREIEDLFTNSGNSEFMDNLLASGIRIDGMTRISLIESAKGLGTIVTFIAIYLGIIFLIASSAILALKELTENTDNRQRYTILRKIGVDEDMLNQSLLRQIGIFFFVPLFLAIIHSVFGITFALKLIAIQVQPEELLPSVIATAIFLIAVYGGYFLATYTGSKNIIQGE